LCITVFLCFWKYLCVFHCNIFAFISFSKKIISGSADALEKWLNLLEGYFFVHNFSDREKITFALLKALPHVKHWWETYWEKSSTEESGIYGVEPTWDFFVDAVKEQYYPVGNYDDQYMRWTTLRQERGQAVSSSPIPSIPCAPSGYQRL
jgi:hypothetical protein